jgi:hypothetical protein
MLTSSATTPITKRTVIAVTKTKFRIEVPDSSANYVRSRTLSRLRRAAGPLAPICKAAAHMHLEDVLAELLKENNHNGNPGAA